ncbi:MAG: DUF5667 domain-containing protein [Acidobacteriaceae bacterium]
MNEDTSHLTNEIIERIKQGAPVSDIAGSSSIAKLAATLNSIPKSQIPAANFERVKDQIFKRIELSKEEKSAKFGFFAGIMPRILRLSGAAIGSMLILISLGIGTAVAALQSVPGQAIYPLKQVVERLELKFANSDTERANLQIKFANNRLDELEKVLEKNRQGQLSEAEVAKVVQTTVTSLTETTKTLTEANVQSQTKTTQPQVQILNKIVDLGSKQTNILQSASIQSEGEIKIELEKALEASKTSMDETVTNIQRAGLKIEQPPIVIQDQTPSTPVTPPTDQVEASGKLTEVTETTLNIGTAKFYLTKDTKFVNITESDLKVDQMVSIKGKISDSKTYVVEISLDTNQSTTPPTTVPSTQQ